MVEGNTTINPRFYLKEDCFASATTESWSLSSSRKTSSKMLLMQVHKDFDYERGCNDHRQSEIPFCLCKGPQESLGVHFKPQCLHWELSSVEGFRYRHTIRSDFPKLISNRVCAETTNSQKYTFTEKSPPVFPRSVDWSHWDHNGTFKSSPQRGRTFIHFQDSFAYWKQ